MQAKLALGNCSSHACRAPASQIVDFISLLNLHSLKISPFHLLIVSSPRSRARTRRLLSLSTSRIIVSSSRRHRHPQFSHLAATSCSARPPRPPSRARIRRLPDHHSPARKKRHGHQGVSRLGQSQLSHLEVRTPQTPRYPRVFFRLWHQRTRSSHLPSFSSSFPPTARPATRSTPISGFLARLPPLVLTLASQVPLGRQYVLFPILRPANRHCCTLGQLSTHPAHLSQIIVKPPPSSKKNGTFANLTATSSSRPTSRATLLSPSSIAACSTMPSSASRHAKA